MPAPPLANNNEGGSNGTVLTQANHGGASGDAMSSAPTDPGSIQKYSSAHAAHGTLSMNITQTASPASTRWEWTGLGAITADVWFRCYLYIPATPSAQFIYAGVRSSAAAALSSQFSVESTGRIMMSLASGAAGVTGTVAVPTNQWFRVEHRVRSSATVGQLEFRLFKTMDSTVADDTGSASSLILGVDTDQVRWGQVTNTIASFVSYHDDFAVSSVNWVGPAVTATSTLLPIHLPFMR